ncbi:MerR family transcriptional regulator [Enterococcus sp. AZ103]|uniref:MerR family transcriptional regulator n=1 Tax=Enterococcus sp. AZ103 TaxID=2774628 RepID=UPI003F202928
MKKSTVRQLLESDDLVVGISELSKMTEVSPRQLRYWEEKGYIESIDTENKGNRRYRLPVVVKVEMIKSYLDEGFTLTTAVEKAQEQQRDIHQAKILFHLIYRGINTFNDRYTTVHLAGFEGEEELLLIRDQLTEKVYFEVLSKNYSLSSEDLSNFMKNNEG